MSVSRQLQARYNPYTVDQQNRATLLDSWYFHVFSVLGRFIAGGFDFVYTRGYKLPSTSWPRPPEAATAMASHQGLESRLNRWKLESNDRQAR